MNEQAMTMLAAWNILKSDCQHIWADPFGKSLLGVLVATILALVLVRLCKWLCRDIPGWKVNLIAYRDSIRQIHRIERVPQAVVSKNLAHWSEQCWGFLTLLDKLENRHYDGRLNRLGLVKWLALLLARKASKLRAYDYTISGDTYVLRQLFFAVKGHNPKIGTSADGSIGYTDQRQFTGLDHETLEAV